MIVMITAVASTAVLGCVEGSDGVTTDASVGDAGNPYGEDTMISTVDAALGDTEIEEGDSSEPEDTGVPPIDRELPDRIETATFALG